MNTWLQLLPKLKPGAEVVISYSAGGQIKDHVINDVTAFGPAYFTCQHNGTYSLRNGWHVLGERRIVDVIEEKVPVVHIATPRENLIKELVKKHPAPRT